jgi:hypothetical protein
VVQLVDQARALAEAELAEASPGRWAHVQAVADKAAAVAEILLDTAEATILVAAAWLHDVGHGPRAANTGFQSLDGARWLRRRGFDGRVTALVAHHPCAQLAADERGLADDLAWEFDDEDSVVSDALWYADMTTGPNGEFVTQAEAAIVAAVRRTEERLRSVGGDAASASRR